MCHPLAIGPAVDVAQASKPAWCLPFQTQQSHCDVRSSNWWVIAASAVRREFLSPMLRSTAAWSLRAGRLLVRVLLVVVRGHPSAGPTGW